ncbi:N-acetylmuramoyl-L-alanine amidase [Luteolibacter arcticus]|uniref:N-acetylmuramoyl-L-alanine amidase n=1 Tax=Luteolibacter arcticus TaxID=1581411 RepID=A0ABT3GC69_9BACT|nr:N-acetylmuramoyl-L-alanine amidase [Luteolibacter arcticus]MCW1921224.1 N-acetylmuramoyl-L-alanine amidase [Luteolibacter arcticus]
MKYPFVVAMLALSAVCFHCSQVEPLNGSDQVVGSFGVSAPGSAPQPVSAPTSGVSSSALAREINLRADMVPRGTHGRKVVRPMKPRYITIHSTQNYSADASRHSLALKRGALRSPKRKGGNRIGYLIWHFTVDDKVALQHMPVTEQGEHADFDGPGNRLSIGIEMCEHRGSNRNATIERTAKLTAKLMHEQGIPLSRIVPHYHWPRRGKSPANKNCPHFLLDNGRPGAKWRWFLGRVDYHYKRAYQQSYVSR